MLAAGGPRAAPSLLCLPWAASVGPCSTGDPRPPREKIDRLIDCCEVVMRGGGVQRPAFWSVCVPAQQLQEMTVWEQDIRVCMCGVLVSCFLECVCALIPPPPSLAASQKNCSVSSCSHAGPTRPNTLVVPVLATLLAQLTQALSTIKKTGLFVPSLTKGQHQCTHHIYMCEYRCLLCLSPAAGSSVWPLARATRATERRGVCAHVCFAHICGVCAQPVALAPARAATAILDRHEEARALTPQKHVPVMLACALSLACPRAAGQSLIVLVGYGQTDPRRALAPSISSMRHTACCAAGVA